MCSRGLVAVYAGEQHIQVRNCLVVGPLHFLNVFVGLVRRCLHHLSIALGGIVERTVVLIAEISVDNTDSRTAVFIHRHEEIARAFGIFLFFECLGEHRTVEKRTVAVLLTVEIGCEREHIVRCVLIHRCIGAGSDEQKRIRRVADEYHENTYHNQRKSTGRHFLAESEHIDKKGCDNEKAQQHRMAYERHSGQCDGKDTQQLCGAAVGLCVESADCEDKQRRQNDRIYEHTHIIRHSESVDKYKFEPLRHLDEARDETVENSAYNDTRHGKSHQRPFGVDILEFTVVINQSESRDAEQVEQVDGNRNTDNIRYQNQIAVGMRLVGTVLPLEHEPHHKRGAERRECIHLAFDCRKPERVAPRIGKRGAYAAAHDQSHLPAFDCCGVIAHNQPLDKMRHRPEQQQDSAGREQGRHSIDTPCHLSHIATGKVGEEAGREHEDRVARRMTDFEFKTLGDELGAVPETRRRLESEQISDGGDEEAGPSEGVVEDVVSSHFRIWLTMR